MSDKTDNKNVDTSEKAADKSEKAADKSEKVADKGEKIADKAVAKPVDKPTERPVDKSERPTRKVTADDPSPQPLRTNPGATLPGRPPSPSMTATPRSAEPVVQTATRGKAPFTDPTLHAVDALDCEALALGLCSDVRPLAGIAGYVDWRLCGRLSDLLRSGNVTGKAGEKVLVPTLGRIPPRRIFIFGWGPRKQLLDGATERMKWMVDVLFTAKVERVALALPEPSAMLLGLVDEHLKKPLGDKLALIFGPDGLVIEDKDTRPIPSAPGPSGAPPAAS